MSRFRARTALSTACLGLVASAVITAPAPADTTFGGDPTHAVTPVTCSTPYNGYPGQPAASCLWQASDTSGVASTFVPFPASGGSGTITSVTLPAMPNPGPMQAVVMTGATTTGTSPSQPDAACCQTKAISPTFTVPANQVTTVPLNLHVSATPANDPYKPGDTALYDVMGISVLAPDKSLPLFDAHSQSIVNNVAYPAPTQPDGEFRGYGYSSGVQVLARFTLGAPGSGTGAPGAALSPLTGLKLDKTIGVPAGARTIGVGRATNPPTAATAQRLLATPKAIGARAAKKKKKKAKTVTIGKGSTKVKSGKSATIKVKLGAKARSRLEHGHRVKATLKITARGVNGVKATTTRSITLKPKKAKKK